MSDAVETFVDLGLLEHERHPIDEPNGQRSPRAWRTIRRRATRPRQFAVPAVALLLLVSAAQAAPSDLVRFAARVPAGIDATVMVEGSTLFVYDARDPAAAVKECCSGSNLLTAYTINGGRRLWTAATVEVPELTTMRCLDGLVVLSMVDRDLAGEHTVAFDAATGRRAWSSDLGYATPAAGGILVEAANRPPGFNYPGTPVTGMFRLLDPRTGATRWSHRVPDNCLTDATDPTLSARVDALAELCLNTSTLEVVDLSTGAVMARRQIDLGDPGANFLLPLADRMAQPQLTVMGDTVLVAHANAPRPTLDAYAMADLRQQWSGVPVSSDADVEPCGKDICIYDDAAGLSGTILDAATGRTVGAAPARARDPADGSLVLLAVNHASHPSTLIAKVGAGMSTGVLELPPDTPTPTWLAMWRTDNHSGDGDAVPRQVLTDVSAASCVEVATLLTCRASIDKIKVWRIASD